MSNMLRPASSTTFKLSNGSTNQVCPRPLGPPNHVCNMRLRPKLRPQNTWIAIVGTHLRPVQLLVLRAGRA